jgi:hypothetical protein
VQLEITSRPGKRVLAANATTSSFASKIPTLTEPTNDGVLDLLNAGTGIIVPRYLKVWPIGLSSNDDAFSVRVLGWTRIGTGPSPGVLWYPTILCELACIMGAAVGIAGSPVLNTEAFCDTITVVTQGVITGTDNALATTIGNVEITSPGNDLIAYAVVPTLAFEKLEFQFDQTTNTPTMNVIVSAI